MMANFNPSLACILSLCSVVKHYHWSPLTLEFAFIDRDLE